MSADKRKARVDFRFSIGSIPVMLRAIKSAISEEEYTKLTAEKKTLNQRYLALKKEVKEAEKIRKSVYSILRQEQREQQPHRKQNMER